MARTDYAPETKAAVMAALLEGQSVSSVASRYSIPKGTVSGWKEKAKKQARSRGVAEDATQKRDGASIGDLLLELLEKNVRSLIAISELATDPEWLRKQGAAEIATLFGVKHDKAVRMIEAMNASDGDAP